MIHSPSAMQEVCSSQGMNILSFSLSCVADIQIKWRPCFHECCQYGLMMSMVNEFFMVWLIKNTNQLYFNSTTWTNYPCHHLVQIPRRLPCCAHRVARYLIGGTGTIVGGLYIIQVTHGIWFILNNELHFFYSLYFISINLQKSKCWWNINRSFSLLPNV